MVDFDNCKNMTEVKATVRKIAMQKTLEAYNQIFGEDNVSVTDNFVIAVCVGLKTLTDGTKGEVCFTMNPTAKDYDSRVTVSGKKVEAFERLSEADAYKVTKKKNEEKARKAKEEHDKRVAHDKEMREQKKAKQ